MHQALKLQKSKSAQPIESSRPPLEIEDHYNHMSLPALLEQRKNMKGNLVTSNYASSSDSGHPFSLLSGS